MPGSREAVPLIMLSHPRRSQGDTAIGAAAEHCASTRVVWWPTCTDNALLRRGSTDQAFSHGYAEKPIADVVPPFLRGRALRKRATKAGARKAMEQALQIVSNYFPPAWFGRHRQRREAPR